MQSHEATQGTIFHFNGDFSGACIITTRTGNIRVPAEDILEMVSYCYIAPNKIREIEQKEWQELLGCS